MKPSENRNRKIPEMEGTFNKVLFRRKIADILRNNDPQEVKPYAEEVIWSFPKEKFFIVSEVERMTNQCLNLGNINNLNFDDYRTPEQSQTFYEGLSNEPSMREKMKAAQRVRKSLPPKDSLLPLSGPDVRYFGD